MSVGWLYLAIPASAGGFAVQVHEPADRWDIAGLPLTPAPMENSLKPLWRPEPEPSLFSFPSEVRMVAYPSSRPMRDTWARLALDKRLLQLTSPLDVLFCPEPPAIEITLARLR